MKRRAIHRDENEQMQTAAHEAGHAVACIALHRRFEIVSIRRSDTLLGYVLHSRQTLLERRKLHERGFIDFSGIVIAAAGMVAERRFSGRFDHAGAIEDKKSMVDIARGVRADGSGMPDYAPRVRLLTRAAMLEAEELVDARWASILGVAAALAKSGTLTFEAANVVAMQADNLTARAKGKGSGSTPRHARAAVLSARRRR